MTLMKTLFCNLLFFISCLPETLAFLWSAIFPRAAQERILRRILHSNANTNYGRRHGFSDIDGVTRFCETIPISDYSTYAAAIEKIRVTGKSDAIVAEPVQLLEPTSGTGSAPKYIPYTRALRREFMAGVHPWIMGLYLKCPSLLFGKQYWSLSPNTQDNAVKHDQVSIGFASDTEYLGLTGRRLSGHLMVVPPELGAVTDPEAFEYLTLLFLLREPNIRLISVWHPSFLTILLDALPAHWHDILADIRNGSIKSDLRLPDPLRNTFEKIHPAAERRAQYLARIDPGNTLAFRQIWPRLRVISCWSNGSASWISRLRNIFPGIWIQEKGLVATEGIVSFPLGSAERMVAAVRSHFLEFLDREKNEIKHLWNLEPDREYVVLLTTGGGLYRYCLRDRIRVAGKFLRTPCLRFLGREGLVSDMVGEKVDLRLVEEAFERTATELGLTLGFAFLAPHRSGDGRCGYVCYADLRNLAISTASRLASALDTALAEGYHYRHARRLGQLESVRVFALSRSSEADYQRYMEANGIKRGDGKFLRLALKDGWHRVFDGYFV